MPTKDKPIWNTGLINNGKLEQVYELSVVRHGHWIYLYDGNYKCSECGSWWTCDKPPIESGLKYCPNCGAKMEEDKMEE